LRPAAEKQKQVRQLVSNQRHPHKVEKRRFACKANYRPPDDPTAEDESPSLAIFVATASAAKSGTQLRALPARRRVPAKYRKQKQATIIILICALACSDHSPSSEAADEKAFRLAVGIIAALGVTSAQQRSPGPGNTRVRPSVTFPPLEKSANSAFGVEHDYKSVTCAPICAPTRAAGADK